LKTVKEQIKSNESKESKETTKQTKETTPTTKTTPKTQTQTSEYQKLYTGGEKFVTINDMIAVYKYYLSDKDSNFSRAHKTEKTRQNFVSKLRTIEYYSQTINFLKIFMEPTKYGDIIYQNYVRNNLNPCSLKDVFAILTSFVNHTKSSLKPGLAIDGIHENSSILELYEYVTDDMIDKIAFIVSMYSTSSKDALLEKVEEGNYYDWEHLKITLPKIIKQSIDSNENSDQQKLYHMKNYILIKFLLTHPLRDDLGDLVIMNAIEPNRLNMNQYDKNTGEVFIPVYKTTNSFKKYPIYFQLEPKDKEYVDEYLQMRDSFSLTKNKKYLFNDIEIDENVLSGKKGQVKKSMSAYIFKITKMYTNCIDLGVNAFRHSYATYATHKAKKGGKTRNTNIIQIAFRMRHTYEAHLYYLRDNDMKKLFIPCDTIIESKNVEKDEEGVQKDVFSTEGEITDPINFNYLNRYVIWTAKLEETQNENINKPLLGKLFENKDTDTNQLYPYVVQFDAASQEENELISFSNGYSEGIEVLDQYYQPFNSFVIGYKTIHTIKGKEFHGILKEFINDENYAQKLRTPYIITYEDESIPPVPTMIPNVDLVVLPPNDVLEA